MITVSSSEDLTLLTRTFGPFYGRTAWEIPNGSDINRPATDQGDHCPQSEQSRDPQRYPLTTTDIR